MLVTVTVMVASITTITTVCMPLMPYVLPSDRSHGAVVMRNTACVVLDSY